MNRGLVAFWSAALAALTAFAEPQAINLETALRLAGAKNLALEAARERVREARSQLDQEKRQLFPWVAPGLGYRRHDGNLQDIVGDVFNASKQSGTAALTLQAQLDLGDSLYRVLAAKQAVAASEAGAEARRRETILAVAAAYTELSRAVANMVTAGEAEQISRKTLEQVRAAVTAGLAFAGDAQRVEVQLGRNEAQLLEARQAVRVASARLAQLLRLPPADELRPELRRSDATVNLAQTRRDGATKGVWLPTVGALAAFGGLAGGRNGDWGNGDDFQDYAIGLSWRVGPGGIGDRSRIRTTDARLRIAELEREQLRDEVVREVVEVRSRAELSAEQVTVVTRTVAAARRLVELTQTRREFGVGMVLEAIEAERELSRAQAEQLQAVAAHNRAQWELWHASGQDETTVRPETKP